MIHLAENVAQSAVKFPYRPALSPGATALTYVELDDLVDPSLERGSALGVAGGTDSAHAARICHAFKSLPTECLAHRANDQDLAGPLRGTLEVGRRYDTRVAA
ncbi:MAG: hypothetical protein ABIQ59_18000 [Nocardioidaceae bacterium]